MAEGQQCQTVFLMRHGARHDTMYPAWKATASRPYDTPLSKRGASKPANSVVVTTELAGLEAPVEVWLAAGQCLFSDVYRPLPLHKGIEVVISSPFLRCIQTATCAYTTLGLPGLHISNVLCEWLAPGNNMMATPQVPAIQDAPGTTFLSQDSEPLPSFPETISECHARYRTALDKLADHYFPQTLLLVTHQACVQEAVRWGGKEEDVEAVYCAHVELSRTSKDSHDWKWEADGGIYEYDTVMLM